MRRRRGQHLVDASEVMPEVDVQTSAMRWAEAFGWDLQYHTHDSRRSEAGFPDLVAIRVRDRRLLVAEFKRASEHPTSSQEAWLEAFRLLGAEVYVWRPQDLDEVERVLA